MLGWVTDAERSRREQVLPSLPRRTVVLVNDDYTAREGEQRASGLCAFEADAAVSDTARAVSGALANLGVEVEELRVTSSLDGLLEALAERRVSTVFNLVESLANDYGREWEVPALLARHGLRSRQRAASACPVSAKDKTRRCCPRRVRAPGARRDATHPTPRGLRSRALPLVKPARSRLDRHRRRLHLRDFGAAARLGRSRTSGAIPGGGLTDGKEINVALFPAPHAARGGDEIDSRVRELRGSSRKTAREPGEGIRGRSGRRGSTRSSRARSSSSRARLLALGGRVRAGRCASTKTESLRHRREPENEMIPRTGRHRGGSVGLRTRVIRGIGAGQSRSSASAECPRRRRARIRADRAPLAALLARIAQSRPARRGVATSSSTRR